jgi:hypothetical protein
MTSMHFDPTDSRLWTRPRTWTPAEALSAPGQSEQRRRMFETGNSVVRFLAGLPGEKSRIIAVHNLFGPNLGPADIAEFLAAIGWVSSPAYIQSVLDDSDHAPAAAAAAPESATGPVTAVERARDSLVAAAVAPTEVKWWDSDRTPLYREPLVALRDAQVASGRAVLAVAEEMSATRAEIAEVAAAIRGLTQTLESVLGGLGSRFAEVEQALDASEVCTERAEIAAALRPVEPPVEPAAPVRRWQLWGKPRFQHRLPSDVQTSGGGRR